MRTDDASGSNVRVQVKVDEDCSSNVGGRVKYEDSCSRFKPSYREALKRSETTSTVSTLCEFTWIYRKLRSLRTVPASSSVDSGRPSRGEVETPPSPVHANRIIRSTIEHVSRDDVQRNPRASTKGVCQVSTLSLLIYTNTERSLM